MDGTAESLKSCLQAFSSYSAALKQSGSDETWTVDGAIHKSVPRLLELPLLSLLSGLCTGTTTELPLCRLIKASYHIFDYDIKIIFTNSWTAVVSKEVCFMLHSLECIQLLAIKRGNFTSVCSFYHILTMCKFNI